TVILKISLCCIYIFNLGFIYKYKLDFNIVDFNGESLKLAGENFFISFSVISISPLDKNYSY
ncbi:hypothetical protein, partial [Mesomycoplasma ovipneumoniae]|uniref:hypothetical protein n=1 Tax=Mesomycoplasma ovipneumoniae TaxID=29562 RepID=UPI0029655263